MHEKDAILLSHKGEDPPPAEKKVDPYSVVHTSQPAGQFHGQQLTALKLGIIHELGESGWVCQKEYVCREDVLLKYDK